MSEIIPVFCINLPTSVDRRNKMAKRFERAGFDQQHVHFVDAAGRDSGLVEYYTAGVEPWSDNVQWKKDIACFASHLLAVRSFLATNAEYGFICEDDILFQNDFMEDFGEIFETLPEELPLLSFTYMASGTFDLDSEGSPYYCKFPKGDVWGAQFYMISRKYAMEVISRFDRPLRELEEYGKLSSEIILMESNGYLLIRPLVIEDCIGSDRKNNDIVYHMKHFCFWRWENFSQSDLEHESPLMNMDPENCWSIYGQLFPDAFEGPLPKSLTPLEVQAEIYELKKLLN